MPTLKSKTGHTHFQSFFIRKNRSQKWFCEKMIQYKKNLPKYPSPKNLSDWYVLPTFFFRLIYINQAALVTSNRNPTRLDWQTLKGRRFYPTRKITDQFVTTSGCWQKTQDSSLTDEGLYYSQQ